VLEKFHKDWDAVSNYLCRHRSIVASLQDSMHPSSDMIRYLWAWLNVNTRCLYDDLGRRREDNISLCPVFDFANHTWKDTNMRPRVPTPDQVWGWTRISRGIAADLTCETLERKVECDEELLLTYGSHANTRLFVEYGFVNAISEEDIFSGEYPGEVIVDDVVMKLAEGNGGKRLLSEMKDTLEVAGYWRYVNKMIPISDNERIYTTHWHSGTTGTGLCTRRLCQLIHPIVC